MAATVASRAANPIRLRRCGIRMSSLFHETGEPAEALPARPVMRRSGSADARGRLGELLRRRVVVQVQGEESRLRLEVGPRRLGEEGERCLDHILYPEPAVQSCLAL